MSRLAVTIEDDLLRLARQASAKRDVSLSDVVAGALREFVAKADIQSAKLEWPPLIKSRRPVSVEESARAIEEGRA